MTEIKKRKAGRPAGAKDKSPRAPNRSFGVTKAKEAGERDKIQTRKILMAYRQHVLNHEAAPQVVEKIFKTALDDNHPHQAACMKMVMERVANVKNFENGLSDDQGSRPVFQVNITTDSPKVVTDIVSEQ